LHPAWLLGLAMLAVILALVGVQQIVAMARMPPSSHPGGTTFASVLLTMFTGALIFWGQRQTALLVAATTMVIIGMKQSVALYHTTETAKQRPFRVSMKNVSDTLDLLVQYGGMDPATRGKPEDYVTLEFLPAE